MCRHVGEYLAGGLDTPEETEENNKPGDRQAAQDGQMHFSKVPNIVRDVQHVVPKKIRLLVGGVSKDIYKKQSKKRNRYETMKQVEQDWSVQYFYQVLYTHVIHSGAEHHQVKQLSLISCA